MSSVGYHVHKNDSEAYYILEGEGLYKQVRVIFKGQTF